MGSGLELLTPEAAARYLGGEESPISVETLRWWRHKRRGPKFFRIGGRRIMYRRADLDNFIERGEVKIEEEAHG